MFQNSAGGLAQRTTGRKPPYAALEDDREKLAGFSDKIMRPNKEGQGAIDPTRDNRAQGRDPQKLADLFGQDPATKKENQSAIDPI